MSIRIRCECGKRLVCKDEHAGKRTRCPGCNKSLAIPNASEAPAATKKSSGLRATDAADTQRRHSSVDAAERSEAPSGRPSWLLPVAGSAGVAAAIAVVALLVGIMGNSKERTPPTSPEEDASTQAAAPHRAASKDAGSKDAPVEKPRDSSPARRIGLLIQTTFLPNTSKSEKPDALAKRLDAAVEYAPGDDVAAALLAIQQAAPAAGYRFEPVHLIKKDEKARDYLSKFPQGLSEVLLVRVSTRTAKVQGGSLLLVMADAALFRLPETEHVLCGGFVAADKLDDSKITGDKVEAKYWLETATRLFAKSFDAEILAEFQLTLDKQEIEQSLAKLKERDDGQPFSTQSSMLEGTNERPPELEVKSDAADERWTVFLEADGKVRRWTLATRQAMVLPIKPGKVLLYAQRGARFFRTETDAVNQRRYLFVLD